MKEIILTYDAIAAKRVVKRIEGPKDLFSDYAEELLRTHQRMEISRVLSEQSHTQEWLDIKLDLASTLGLVDETRLLLETGAEPLAERREAVLSALQNNRGAVLDLLAENLRGRGVDVSALAFTDVMDRRWTLAPHLKQIEIWKEKTGAAPPDGLLTFSPDNVDVEIFGHAASWLMQEKLSRADTSRLAYYAATGFKSTQDLLIAFQETGRESTQPLACMLSDHFGLHLRLGGKLVFPSWMNLNAEP